MRENGWTAESIGVTMRDTRSGGATSKCPGSCEFRSEGRDTGSVRDNLEVASRLGGDLSRNARSSARDVAHQGLARLGLIHSGYDEYFRRPWFTMD